MALEQPETPVKCGKYKTLQLNRLKKLYGKLDRYFNEKDMVTKTRKQLRKMIENASIEVKMMPQR